MVRGKSLKGDKPKSMTLTPLWTSLGNYHIMGSSYSKYCICMANIPVFLVPAEL
jgi:hypothetical protein